MRPCGRGLITSAIVRRILIALALLAVPLAAFAQSDQPSISIVDVSGPLDASALRFMGESIDDAAARGMELVVLQINSPAALDAAALDQLIFKVTNPPLPVAVWLGPAPAQAHGGAGALVLAAEVAAAAPGSTIGILTPRIAGDDPIDVGDDPTGGLLSRAVPVEETGLEQQPTIRQYLQDLNGRTFNIAEGPVTVETIEEITVDGETGVTVKEAVLAKPGLGTRFFRLAVTPEAAFFFLVVGLTIITFEFFAIGPGVAAGVASISLILAGWGMVNLPMRPWALFVAVAGWILLTASYQRGGVVFLTILGAAMLQVAGTFYVDGSGQIDPRWWLVLPSVLAVLFFFLLAMPTVQRARFSTQVLGRESLVGSKGVALEDFDPDGTVEVNGARWRATAHREAGIERDAEVVVSGVDGLFLEVERVR